MNVACLPNKRENKLLNESRQGDYTFQVESYLLHYNTEMVSLNKSFSKFCK